MKVGEILFLSYSSLFFPINSREEIIRDKSKLSLHKRAVANG